MSRPRQYTLAIDLPLEQRLDNFVPGRNAELLAVLTAQNVSFQGVWLFGGHGSGRSHLLKGACLQAQERGEQAVYIACAQYAEDPDRLVSQLQSASQGGDLVALDDVEVLIGHLELEMMVLAIYQRLLFAQGRLLVTHQQTASSQEFVTLDVSSRMRSLQHFHLRPPQDGEKMQILSERAQQRGYVLTRAVLDYWMARGPRELGALLADLDLLDAASLVAQQKITIPLLKQVLGY